MITQSFIGVTVPWCRLFSLETGAFFTLIIVIAKSS